MGKTSDYPVGSMVVYGLSGVCRVTAVGPLPQIHPKETDTRYYTLLPLWVPAFLGNAYYIFLLRQYYLTIPQPILDAARVAGCSHMRLLWQIIVPMARPVFIIMVLNTFLATWSDLFGPLVYILQEQDRTFPVLLSYMNSSYGNAGTLPAIMAGGVLSAIPTLIIYFLSQKAMIKAYVFRSGDK